MLKDPAQRGDVLLTRVNHGQRRHTTVTTGYGKMQVVSVLSMPSSSVLHRSSTPGRLAEPIARGLAASGPRRDWVPSADGEVMGMRYLLVLDMDLLALDEELDLEPVNYLLAQQEQQPCDVVVLS